MTRTNVSMSSTAATMKTTVKRVEWKGAASVKKTNRKRCQQQRPSHISHVSYHNLRENSRCNTKCAHVRVCFNITVGASHVLQQLCAPTVFTVSYWAVFSVCFSFHHLTYWQLNPGVVTDTPLGVWATPVRPSVACFQLSDRHQERAERGLILQCQPALTRHNVCAVCAVVSLTEELPVVPVLRWIGTLHSYWTSHNAAQFIWLHTAPLCQAEGYLSNILSPVMLYLKYFIYFGKLYKCNIKAVFQKPLVIFFFNLSVLQETFLANLCWICLLCKVMVHYRIWSGRTLIAHLWLPVRQQRKHPGRCAAHHKGTTQHPPGSDW